MKSNCMQYIILAKLTLAASEFFCCQRRKLSESQHHTTVTQKKLLILRVQFLHIVLATYSGAYMTKSSIPLAQTFRSQNPKWKVIFNCTMTYLAGGRSALLHCRLTVAPADTVPGYWPHTTYCPRTGGEISEDKFVRPIIKLSDCWSTT